MLLELPSPVPKSEGPGHPHPGLRESPEHPAEPPESHPGGAEQSAQELMYCADFRPKSPRGLNRMLKKGKSRSCSSPSFSRGF